MAKVSLRIYNREIESLIDQGQNDEAVAHCLHILKTFPKHLETYRLLGKAFLESKKYGEAVDIFSRLLVCVPDDFVAHVGMSIINDEQAKLDNAIWHMERAFEAQPSNAAIQGELQRLYGRRDGMEPPKIRMTRGSLANMYVQGELYAQAISEIRGVLATDPKRIDMQVLLAKALFKSGQKADASDMCNQLLKASPYCLEANRIMVELLPTTAGSESTQAYRTRVIELDPYAAFAQGSVYRASDVPDASISLDRLDYRPGDAVPTTPDWGSSLGIGLAPTSFSKDEQPDWLKPNSGDSAPAFDSMSFGESTPASPAAASAKPGDEIPEFLRAAGWGESSGGPEQPYSLGESDSASSGDALAPAEMPDWMKAMAPSPESPAPAADSIDDGSAWLSGLEAAAANATGASSINLFDEPVSFSSSSQNNAPDWLSGSSGNESSLTPAQPASEDDAPDWLSGLGGSTASTKESQSDDMPDWLRGSTSETTVTQPSVESVAHSTPSAEEQDDAVAWLESLASKHGAKPEELVTDPNKRSDVAPQWVEQSRSIPQPTPAAQAGAPSAEEQDDAVAWLESLASKHGAKPEELVTDPNKRSDIAPQWVEQSRSTIAQPIPAAQAGAPSAQEQDDAVAWLESLASKHGAKPEELVTDPNKRTDKAPDWVEQSLTDAQAQNVGEQFMADFDQGQNTTPSPMDTTGAWLRSLEEDKKPDSKQPAQWSSQAQNIGEQFMADFEEAETNIPGTDTTGDWLRGLQEEEKPKQPAEWSSQAQNIGEQFMADFETPEKKDEPVADKGVTDWLAGLDENAVDHSHTPEPSFEKLDEWTPPDSIKPTRSEPVYVDDPFENTPASSKGADIPAWMKDDSLEVDDQRPKTKDEGLPSWLAGASEPEPTMPTDWKPLEPKSSILPAASTPKPAPVSAPQPKSTSPRAVEPTADTKEDVSKPLTRVKPSSTRIASKLQSTAARQTEKGSQSTGAVLDQAQSELSRGDIPAAVDRYQKLIKKGKNLDEAIHDLRDALYRYPVEVSIWQTLGDAYMRANRLQEALDSYTKAEELLR